MKPQEAKHDGDRNPLQPSFDWTVMHMENPKVDFLWQAENPMKMIEDTILEINCTSHRIDLDQKGGFVNMRCSWNSNPRNVATDVSLVGSFYETACRMAALEKETALSLERNYFSLFVSK
jgi:hypothetical protein